MKHGVDAPLPTGTHHLTLCFTADGSVDFYPTTNDPEELALRFARLIRALVEHPSAIACAAGWHQERPHAG